jgi:hypothetical protein
MAGDGWYAGLAAGFDHGTGVRFNSPFTSPPSTILAKQSDGAIVVASTGYKWPLGFRVELDAAYTQQHSFNGTTQTNSNLTVTPQFTNVINKIGGSSNVTSLDFNVLYDLRLNRKWTFTVGGGYGVGFSSIRPTATITSTPAGVTPQAGAGIPTTLSGNLANGNQMGLESQLMAGVNYSLTPTTELTLDFRRRSNEVNRPLPSAFPTLAPAGTDGVYVASVSSVSVMAGVRFYLNPTGR